MPAFPLGRIAGAAAPGGLESPTVNSIQAILLAPHQEGTSKVGDVVAAPGPSTTSGLLSRGFGRQDLPR